MEYYCVAKHNAMVTREELISYNNYVPPERWYFNMIACFSFSVLYYYCCINFHKGTNSPQSLESNLQLDYVILIIYRILVGIMYQAEIL